MAMMVHGADRDIYRWALGTTSPGASKYLHTRRCAVCGCYN